MKVGSVEVGADGHVSFRAEQGLMGGRRYTVHDVTFSDGLRRLAVGAVEATHRVFVQADTGRWTYAFQSGEGRELVVAELERQLQAATYSMPDHTRGNPR